jgi:hypothetical protein
MAAEMFAETLDSFQNSSLLISEGQGFTVL